MAVLQIKKFEDLLTDFNQKLTNYGSQITNRQEGGAFDLLIRINCLQVSDAYSLLEQEKPNIFPISASGAWLDFHGQSVGLAREQATKTLKEFRLTRDAASGTLQIPVGDVLKTPVLPSRGQLRFVTTPKGEVDFTGSATAAETWLEDTTKNFIESGVKIGSYVFNLDDGSYGPITAIEETKITVILKSGTTNEFAIGDQYRFSVPSPYAGEFTERVNAYAALGSIDLKLVDDINQFDNLPYLQVGQKIYNITDGSSGIIVRIEAHEIDCDSLIGGVNNTWSLGDEYAFETDYEIIITAESRFEGSEANNMEIIIGRQGEAVECEVDSGFTGVDHIYSTGEDLQAGADVELDNDFRTRILNRWKELASGSTSEAYKNFARSSSSTVFDANVYKGSGPTDVQVVLSGNPGSRNLAAAIGIKVDLNDNFDSYYTSDGTSGGNPCPLGITVHEYIRARAPLTDIIYLSSVGSVRFNIDLKVKIIEGFIFTIVKQELLKRLRGLFLVEKTVKDVVTLAVGEPLLFSRLAKIVSNTPGIADFKFDVPNQAVNYGDTSIDPDKVFTLGTMTIGEL